MCCHYVKHRAKQKTLACQQYKIENTELKKVVIETCMSYYFDDITIEDFDFDNSFTG